MSKVLTQWHNYFYNLQLYTFLCEIKTFINEELKKHKENTLYFGIQFDIPLERIGYDVETGLNDYFKNIVFDNVKYDVKSNAFERNPHCLPDFIISLLNIDNTSLYTYFGGIRSYDLVKIFPDFFKQKKDKSDDNYEFVNFEVSFENYKNLNLKINEYLKNTFRAFKDWQNCIRNFDDDLSKFFNDFYGDKNTNLPPKKYEIINDYLQINSLLDFTRVSLEDEKDRRGEKFKTNIKNNLGEKIGIIPYKPNPSINYEDTLERLFSIEGTFLLGYLCNLAIDKWNTYNDDMIEVDIEELVDIYKDKWLKQIYSDTSSYIKSDKKIKTDILSMIEILSKTNLTNVETNKGKNEVSIDFGPLIYIRGVTSDLDKLNQKQYFDALKTIKILVPKDVIPKLRRGNYINTTGTALIPEKFPTSDKLTPKKKEDLRKLQLFISEKFSKELEPSKKRELKKLKDESGAIPNPSFQMNWEDVLRESEIINIIDRPTKHKEYLKELIKLLINGYDDYLSKSTKYLNKNGELLHDIEFVAHKDFCSKQWTDNSIVFQEVE